MDSKRPDDYPKTPTLDKILAVRADSRVISGFLEWMSRETELVLCELSGGYEPVYSPTPKSFSEILHDYFGIDSGQEGLECMALLEYVKNADFREEKK